MAASKLTLSIDPETIEKGKNYAQKRHISLSKLVRKFLQSISEEDEGLTVSRQLNEYPEWMQELIIADMPTPDFDHKDEFHKHLEDKLHL